MTRAAKRGKSKAKEEVLRLLDRRLGSVPADLVAQVEDLSLEPLEQLAEALLDFALEQDLRNWLAVNG